MRGIYQLKVDQEHLTDDKSHNTAKTHTMG